KDVSVAVDFIAKKDGMPVLTHVLIDSDGKGHCRMMATDLEVSWSKVSACKGDKIAKCLPAALLLKEVKALPVDVKEVVLDFKDNTVSVNGRCKIFTLGGEDFPVKPEVKKWTGLSIDNFISGLESVSRAMGKDDTRYQLNGAYLDLERNKVVATDGHRLHMETVRVRGDKASSLIIPRRAVSLMLKYPMAEIPKLTRQKGKPKVGEAIDKPAKFDLDVFGHKVHVRYEPQIFQKSLYGANLEYKGPVSSTGYLDDHVSADIIKQKMDEMGSLKDCVQALAEDKYLLLNKTVSITVSENYMTYPVAEGEMLIKTIDGAFPKYADIIPKKNPIKVRFSSADFLQNMNGVLPLNNEAVILKINSHLTIETQSPDKGTYKWQIPCKTEGKDKGTVEIKFNARYVIEAIKSYESQEVVLELKDTDKDPAIINKNAIVMPMRM
ncbi:MAG: hypothetical protein FJ240_06370, partial [Nitrospira sp.]|nr:hypothetical protein [Nitrospira sp.]